MSTQPLDSPTYWDSAAARRVEQLTALRSTSYVVSQTCTQPARSTSSTAPRSRAPWWAPEPGTPAAYVQAVARTVTAAVLWLVLVLFVFFAAPLGDLLFELVFGGAR